MLLKRLKLRLKKQQVSGKRARSDPLWKLMQFNLQKLLRIKRRRVQKRKRKRKKRNRQRHQKRKRRKLKRH